jgi:GrpB-like predicted nucleotidyltransferase (UPF0157 family)
MIVLPVLSTDMGDWEVTNSAGGGIDSVQLRGVELLAGEARSTAAGASRWHVEHPLADRIDISPAEFELAQAMTWPFRYERAMAVVYRGRDLMPLRVGEGVTLARTDSVRLEWPSTLTAVSFLWDQPRLGRPLLTFRAAPARLEVTITPGRAEGRLTSWWVNIRDGNSQVTGVELVEYDPTWPAEFERKRAELQATLGDLVVAIHHGGSTAVPGLAAKPVIDIWAELSRPIERVHVEAMTRIGYVYLGEAAMADHDLFVRRSEVKCNLHCFPAGHPEIDRHIGYRDWLRAHPDGAATYAQLKRGLAIRFSGDRLAYTEAKSDFIEAALRGDFPGVQMKSAQDSTGPAYE